jgi:hypothetical protein
MAQWNGQYTGNSHATKVEDHENMLKHSVQVFDSCDQVQRVTKGKAVKKLAAKVFNARLKMVRAKLYDAEPVKSADWQRDKFRWNI